MESYKQCPYCWEEIKEDTTECKYCWEWIDDTQNNIDDYNAIKELRKKEIKKWICSLLLLILFFCIYIVILLIIYRIFWFEKIEMFFLLLIVLPAYSLSIRVFKKIINIIHFKLDTKEKMVNNIYSTLKCYNFPNPQEYENTINDYSFLKENNSSKPKDIYKNMREDIFDRNTLILIQTFIAELATNREESFERASYKLSSVHKEALRRYAKDFNEN